ncbi:MAG: relaxase/mobilization nuclease domain-containing protein, partial [Synechococcales cyanobacterium CRU_2_2]|nr:relaxase/mobilization nuclease domain-containing protein [Synechococcales cyanobacterium CRU_2_2]
PIGEALSDHDWRELSKDFLARMGFADHQYVLVQHTDRDHEHVHIIANRVGLDGAVVPDAWDYQRAEAVARQLETAYGLQPLRSSGATDRKALSHRQLAQEQQTGQPCVQRQLQSGIDAVLPGCHHFQELAEGLTARVFKPKSPMAIRISRSASATPRQG